MDHIAQIKARLPISEVVGSYIKLERAGSNLRAVCPFHKEKTPSFNVSPSRDAYYCFGCAKGGDIFTFVQEIEGISFPEALKILADRAGIQLPERGSQYLAEKKDDKERLVDLMDKTTSIFEAQLKNHPEVIDYLHKRGLTDETISKFRIGFAPLEWRVLYEALKAKGFRDDDIERARLVKKIEGKGYYDTFRGRVMFPIMDASGRVVAFTGRVFGDQKTPDGTPVAKYLNSPEGELYDKSSILFGYDRAKLAIRKNDFVIVVEGQMDCIMSIQAGMENTIAISGTALTQNHVNLIKRLTNKIIFALDMDNAGVNATIRSSKIALHEDMQVKVAMVPDGKDPADYILAHPHNWNDVVSQAEPVIPYLLKLYAKQNIKGEVLRERVQKEVFPLILSLKSRIAQAQVISSIARALNVKENDVSEDINNYLKTDGLMEKHTIDNGLNEVAEVRKKVVVSPKRLAEDELLGLILWQNEVPEKAFNVESVKNLYSKLCSDYNFEEYIIEDNDKIKLAIIAESKYSPTANFEEISFELLTRIEKEMISESVAKISENIRSSQNKGEDSSVHLQELNKLMKKQRSLEDKIKNRIL